MKKAGAGGLEQHPHRAKLHGHAGLWLEAVGAKDEDGHVVAVLRIADGCVVGSSLKVDGNTWNPVDPERAAEFMRIVRETRQ